MLAVVLRVSNSAKSPLSQVLRPAGRLFLSNSHVMQASSNDEEPIKYPIPPFTEETAKQKVKAAQVSIPSS